jgi:hypothetical protein
MIKQRILQVDGNYFAMRMLGGLNMGDRINNLETNEEKKSFTASLNSSLILLWDTFSPFVDNIVFTTDNHSWRKDITPHKPYYIEEGTLIGYKEQRKAKKEESSINYNNFYSLYRDFIESLKTKMIVFDIYGLEGDDILMLISNKLKDNREIELITFCTDGDLMQIVKHNSMLFRNIKSKDSPFGEFVLSYVKYCELYEQDAKTQLLGGNGIDASFYRRMFKLSVNGNSSIDRTLHRGINIATPFKVALVKSICGDKKDNLFSILGWKSSTGNLNYKITDKHIEKALEKHKYKLSENVCQQILLDKNLLVNLMISLKDVCKQPDADLKDMGAHLKHNLRMNILAVSNIPEKYLIEFNDVWNALGAELTTGKFDSKLLKSSVVTQKDSTSSLLENSIPDIADEILGTSKQIKNQPIIIL